MDEDRQAKQPVRMTADELEALIALVEARVVDNLTRIIERLARESRERGT